MPSSILDENTLSEILFNAKTSYKHFRVFGCLCYVHNNLKPKDKFGERTRRCVFISYLHGKKGRRVSDLESSNIFMSWDVVFCENIFPFFVVKLEHKYEAWSSNLSQNVWFGDKPRPNNEVSHIGSLVFCFTGVNCEI